MSEAGKRFSGSTGKVWCVPGGVSTLMNSACFSNMMKFGFAVQVVVVLIVCDAQG
jgi:hypothetical protein